MALTLGSNITIWDMMGGPDEDQEVEPNCQWDQAWDLEGFFLKDTTLTMVGGYDFDGGVGRYGPGDIFLDTNFDAEYGTYNTGSNPGSGNTVNDTFGYEYALRLNFPTDTTGAGTYAVYYLDPDSTLLKVSTVYFDNNDESNPWMYDSGGTLCGSGNFAFYDGLDNGDVGGLQGSSHYAIQLELLPLLGTEFISHYTYECGNDNLMGDTRTVPEPGTMLLLGAGLIGLACVGRKKIFTRG